MRARWVKTLSAEVNLERQKRIASELLEVTDSPDLKTGDLKYIAVLAEQLANLVMTNIEFPDGEFKLETTGGRHAFNR